MADPKFHWSDKTDRAWRIGYGASNFLVCEGSGFSRLFGERLYRDLMNGVVKFHSYDWGREDAH